MASSKAAKTTPLSSASDPDEILRSIRQEKQLAGRYMMISGAVLLLIGGVIYVYLIGAILLGQIDLSERTLFVHDSTFIAVMMSFGDVSIIAGLGLLTLLIGVALMRGSIRATSKTIPDEDRPLLEHLIRENKIEGIESYVKLSALVGSTGLFTKLGFTGLPLATVTLTMVLVVLAIWRAPDGVAVEPNLLDMAKLTLGAFIGSFVQRKMSQDAGEPGSI
ncbi:MAG: hypothetical protein AAGA12_11135 [Pseudomonadota bacterium]